MSEVAVLEEYKENRGGRRPGSGGKPGMPNKFSRELIEATFACTGCLLAT